VAKEQTTIFIESPSGNDLVMNDTLSEFMKGNPLKITPITRDSITRARKKIHGWRVTIQTD